MTRLRSATTTAISLSVQIMLQGILAETVYFLDARPELPARLYWVVSAAVPVVGSAHAYHAIDPDSS
jgi:hypothetical protein